MSEIIMPKVGDAMTEGKVVRWYKKAGDSVTAGEPVAEIETDKVNMDLEADEAGVIDRIVAEEGATVEVGQPLALLRGEGQAAGASKSAGQEGAGKDPETGGEGDARRPGEQDVSKKGGQPKQVAEASTPKPREKGAGREDAASAEKSGSAESGVQPQSRTSAAPPPAKDGRAKSSPLARRMAEEMGVDLQGLDGSGPGGRIVAADIEKAAKATGTAAKKPAKGASIPSQAPVAIEARDVPLTSMRKTIARRLSESLGPVPHFFLTIEADVTDLLATREQLNEIHNSKVSINDFVIRACALALLEHPNVNASFGPEAIRQHGDVHIGIAVATAEGLITPVIRNADRKGVLEIATEVRKLAEKARNRKLMPDEYQGSTFTISNLGMYGIEEFTAIINPPNAAIVAVGAAMARPVALERQVVVRDRMRMTMSCDHRVIDGAAGAEYMQTLQRYIEQPLRLVMSLGS